VFKPFKSKIDSSGSQKGVKLAEKLEKLETKLSQITEAQSAREKSLEKTRANIEDAFASPLTFRRLLKMITPYAEWERAIESERIHDAKRARKLAAEKNGIIKEIERLGGVLVG